MHIILKYSRCTIDADKYSLLPSQADEIFLKPDKGPRVRLTLEELGNYQLSKPHIATEYYGRSPHVDITIKCKAQPVIQCAQTKPVPETCHV